jgi:hypothetical protein
MKNSIILLGLLWFMGITACRDQACETVSCQNAGECNDGYCYCPNGYTGEYCQYLTCDLVNCPTNATCFSNGAWGAGVCKCNNGFEGIDCATQSINKFLGDYTAVEVCNISPGSTPIWIVSNNFNGWPSTQDLWFSQPQLSWAQPIFAQIRDSLSFFINPQFSQFHNSFIHAETFGKLHPADGTIHFTILLENSFPPDTCHIVLTPN